MRVIKSKRVSHPPRLVTKEKKTKKKSYISGRNSSKNSGKRGGCGCRRNKK